MSVRLDYSKKTYPGGGKVKKSKVKGKLAQVYKGAVTSRKLPVTLAPCRFLKNNVPE